MERRIVERGASHVRIEKREDGGNMLVGYGAVFYRDGEAGTEYELWRGVMERVSRNAFKRALKEKQDVRGLFNHDPSHVLGRTTSKTMRLSVDDIGLRYEIDLPDTASGRDVGALVERGDVTGSSFSFAVVKETWQRTDDGELRILEDLDLFDTGPVTFPAYEGTTAGVRSAGTVDEARASYDVWRAADGQAAAAVAVLARAAEVDSLEAAR